MRSERARLLPRGERVTIPGSHHLHMEDPLAVAEAIGDFFLR
jgi:pimeloyl-ACP methyl ester carboxylesterase